MLRDTIISTTIIFFTEKNMIYTSQYYDMKPMHLTSHDKEITDQIN